jgi:hypothetical protein
MGGRRDYVIVLTMARLALRGGKPPGCGSATSAGESTLCPAATARLS